MAMPSWKHDKVNQLKVMFLTIATLKDIIFDVMHLALFNLRSLLNLVSCFLWL